MAAESDDIDNIVNSTKTTSNNSIINTSSKLDTSSISGSGGGSIPRKRGHIKQPNGQLAGSSSIEDITSDGISSGNKSMRNIGKPYN